MKNILKIIILFVSILLVVPFVVMILDAAIVAPSGGRISFLSQLLNEE